MNISSHHSSLAQILLKIALTLSGFGVLFYISFLFFSNFVFLSKEDAIAPSPQNLQTEQIEIKGTEEAQQDEQNIVQNGDILEPDSARSYPPALLAYNIASSPSLTTHNDVQAIVNQVTHSIQNKGLPLDKLSISLITLEQSQCCKYGGYQDRISRFPASVSKLFWLVAFLAQSEQGLLDITRLPDKDLYKLAHKSDNEAASRVLDLVTGTTSGESLNPDFLGIWDAQRKWINRFFEQAGYRDLNVSQKNFPIPFLDLSGPEGRDLQMRGDLSNPLRNYMTTHDAARLMYEIATSQSVSPAASQEMQRLLTQDLHPDTWKPIQYNSVEGFLGEFLPPDTRFVTKVGWTSQSRQEVAFVTSPDGQTQYILAIFGDDRAYADDWEIFPQVSRLVFDAMVSRQNYALSQAN